MKRRIAVLALLWLGVGVGLAACYDKDGTGQGSLNDPLDVGQATEKARLQMVPGALNVGSLTPAGQDDPFGAFLAAEQLTAAGRPVNIVQMDSTDYPAGQFDTRIQGMIDAGLPVLFTSGSGDMLETYAFGKDEGVLCISNGATSTEITSVTRPPDLLFRTCPTDKATGRILARLTFDQITATAGSATTPTAGVLFQADDSYSLSLSTSFQTEFQALGGSVRVVEAGGTAGFTNDAVDAAILDVFAAPAPTRVVVIAQANPDPASTILIEWVHLGLGTPDQSTGPSPWIFCDAMTVPFLINNLPGAIRGAVDGSLGVSLAKGVGPGFSQFTGDYSARFGRGPVEFVSNSYDAIALLGLAAQRALTVSGNASPTGLDLAPHLRAVASGNGSPTALTVTAGIVSLRAGLQAIEAGQEVKYRGAYSDFSFSPVGDLAGTKAAAYTIVRFNAIAKKYDSVFSQKVDAP